MNFLSISRDNGATQKQIGDYEIGKILGKGKFGKVCLAYRWKNGEKKTYAMKIILKRKVENAADLSRIRREAKIMKSLKHPHIIRCFKAFETEKEICLITEYAEGGDLLSHITDSADGHLSLNEACRVFRQLVNAVRYCHTHQVVHRDLKPENIFLDKNKNIKIGDFGFSRVYKESGISTPCGSLAYVAPEVISGKNYIGPTADIWSLGCIFYMMIVGRLPFEGMGNPEIIERIRTGDFHDHQSLTDRTKKFLRKVLNPNCDERYQLHDIALHSAIWEDKHLLHKALRPFALKIAYKRPYQQIGLDVQSFTESQLNVILLDRNHNNFLSEPLCETDSDSSSDDLGASNDSVKSTLSSKPSLEDIYEGTNESTSTNQINIPEQPTSYSSDGGSSNNSFNETSTTHYSHFNNFANYLENLNSFKNLKSSTNSLNTSSNSLNNQFGEQQYGSGGGSNYPHPHHHHQSVSNSSFSSYQNYGSGCDHCDLFADDRPIAPEKIIFAPTPEKILDDISLIDHDEDLISNIKYNPRADDDGHVNEDGYDGEMEDCTGADYLETV